MISKFDGTCHACKGVLPKGLEIRYDSKLKRAFHPESCPTPDETLTYSNSAQQQAFKSSGKDKNTWLAGAAGERRVKEELDKLEKEFSKDELIILHDLTIPGSKANLDHVVITPVGVYYIDAKHYAQKQIHFTIEGSTLGSLLKAAQGKSAGFKHLTIDGKTSDTTIEPFYWELEQLQKILPEEVKLQGVLCFVNGLWESILTNGWVNNGWFNLNKQVTVCSPDFLEKHIETKSKHTENFDIQKIYKLIESKFPEME